MAQVWKQICAVVWKHYKIRKRKYIITFLEVVLPVAIFILAAYARSNIPSVVKEHLPISIGEPKDDIMLLSTIYDTKLLYTPSTNFTDTITKEIQLKTNMDEEAIIGFANKEKLMEYYRENGNEGITVIVSFDGVDERVPSKLNYDLQIYEQGVDWQTDRLYRNDISYIPGVGSLHYLGNQFIAFQYAIDISFIELITEAPLLVSMTFTEFPYPPHWADETNNKFLSFLPHLTVLSFIFLFPSILRTIVTERTSGMKQLMKVNGLRSSAYWSGWYLNAFLLCCLSCTTITILLTHKIFHEQYAPLQYVDFTQLLFLLLLFCSATITFIFFFSIIFKKATLAMVVGITTWLVSYIVYVSAASNMEIVPLYVKMIASFMPHVALYYGFEIIALGEIRGRTVGFTEAPRGSTSEDMTMNIVVVMLAVDTVLYLGVTLLCETDSLGKFILTKLYKNIRRGISKKHEKGKSDEGIPLNSTTKNNTHIEHCDKPHLLKIENLAKKYDDIAAVNDLSLKIYKGDVMVLLGHNGAGKTTILSILAGLLKETSGDININTDANINRTDRQFVSICPQKDMLFPELSVEEHLEFFGKLKGINSTKIKEDVEDILENKLKLSDKRHELPNNLSGGMKRQLSIAIAMIGKPTLIILDEPTAGIYIEECRDVWDLILNSKDESTFIVSTQIMQEAETLASRVAIVVDGELVSYGTPKFLKNLYDVGYRIELECASKEELLRREKSLELQSCRTSCSRGPGVAEYCITNTHQLNLPRLLDTLQHLKDWKQIINYHLSSVSFEDIFLKSMEHSRQIQNDQLPNHNKNCNNTGANPSNVKPNIIYNFEFYRKFLIICQKKFAFLKKTWATWSAMVMTPPSALMIKLTRN